ncbi:MAG: choline ABC transporter permease subunit [Pseudomonadota bacterium]
MDWLTDNKLPVGKWAAAIVDWLTDNASGFFDGLSFVLEGMIDTILAVLEAIPALLLIAAIIALAYAVHRSWKLAGAFLVGLLFIVNQGYWDETLETLTLVVSACILCMAVGVPIGIAAAHRPRLYRVLRPILDLMQTLPTFVYLIPAIVFFGIGMVPGLIATCVFVVPAPIRLTYLGVVSTPREQLEAGRAFGATDRKLLFDIELPSARPQIMTGLNQTIMLSLSMVVIAALVGADGLGVPIVRALNQVNTSLGFEAGFVIVVVAILLDRLLATPKRFERPSDH